MTKKQVMEELKDDFQKIDDFIKNNNYQTLDCCFNCVHSNYNIENELYCKKMHDETSGSMPNISVVESYGKCDLFEIDLARD